MARTNHSVLAGLGSPATAPAALRGRGAVTNVQHRFQKDSRLVDESCHESPLDASQTPSNPVLRTQVIAERAVKLLSRNDSPDIPFDQAVNPYRGCEHGCVYCYARPTHAYLGYSPGLDFETKLIVKTNSVEALRAEFAHPRYRVSPVNIGSATDVYQPIEREWKLTRGLLELFLETQHPLTVVTKNALIERDIDLLKQLAEQKLVAVYISVTSLDAEMSRTLEPRASAPWRRIEAVRRLADAGIPVGVLVAPLIPFINDEYLERILNAAHDAGAYYASYTVVRLPWEVKTVFEEWLMAHFPDRAERVLHRIEDMREGKRNDPRFGSRMRGTGIWADLLRQRFDLAARRLGLNRNRLFLDRSRFRAPVVPHPSVSSSLAARAGQVRSLSTAQLGLFPSELFD
jgi:DNA repair photolyase